MFPRLGPPASRYPTPSGDWRRRPSCRRTGYATGNRSAQLPQGACRHPPPPWNPLEHPKGLSVLMNSQAKLRGKIVIEDDVWIGANVVVTRNVRIGTGGVIAAGSVVTGDIPPFVVAGGVPARAIRLR